MEVPAAITIKKPAPRVRSPLPLILGFMCYQFILCFINTNVVGLTNVAVAATEAVLLLALAWRILPTCRVSELAAVFLMLAYFFTLWVVRGDVDPAGPRNSLVILLAFALGRANPDREAANKIIWVVSIVVLIGAGLEYFFTDIYLRIFNILHYYIARGEVSEAEVGWVKQSSFVNGFRASGRNMLPFLGAIRVSSIFLEPVSMGNYAIILCLWGLSFDIQERRRALGHFIVAFVLIIAADSRFASLLVFFLFLIRLMPVLQRKAVIYALPCLAVAGLLAFTSLGLGNAADDTLPGRLMRSGQAVIDMNFAQFLGFGIPDSLGDMGVAYSIEHFGVFLCVVLWLVFAMQSLRNPPASRFRLMLSLYGLGILLISGTSFYSTKTAILVWFLYGVLYGMKPSEGAADPVKAKAGLIGPLQKQGPAGGISWRIKT